MHTQEFINEMKTRLLEAKEKLSADLAGLVPHTEMGNDVGENSEEIELDEVNQDLIARLQADLDKIEKALGKIESGTYGIDDSGNEISEERLKVLPWADKAI